MENSLSSHEFVEGFDVLCFEDYSDSIVLKEHSDGNFYEYKDCDNHCAIIIGSFSRLVDRLATKDFVIMSAYRKEFTKKENIIRNRHLRGILNDHKMGVHQLVGHWLEAKDGVEDYTKVPKSELVDVIERSYVVTRPDDMDVGEFKNLMMKCMTIDGATQDAIIYHHLKDEYFLLYNNGKMESIGTELSLNHISQAYSQHVKKVNLPFVIVGVETPITDLGRMTYTRHNILYCE